MGVRIRYIAAAACLLVASCSRPAEPPQERSPAGGEVAPAPATPSPAPVQSERAIQDIRDRYADVRRRLPSFREVTFDLTGLSTQGGELRAFLDGKTPRLTRATFYGETGRVDREFYYDASGRLFFVLETESRYDAPLGETARTQEYRYYFDEGRLLRLLAGDREVSGDEAAYAPRVRNVIELSGRLLEAAKQR